MLANGTEIQMESDPIIGIDLGTTNARVAVVESGVPKIIPSTTGRRATPSVVAITGGGRRLVGHTAREQALPNLYGTFFASKRLLGRRFNSSAVTAAIERHSYSVIEGPHRDVRLSVYDATYGVPEVNSMILAEMKLIAEQYLERGVTKCVISVPAFFDSRQRQATRDAGRIAGFDIIRLINAPTAAALAHAHGKSLEHRVAVFDLGGGTFDISVLDISGASVQVVASAGDTGLGGEDFNDRITQWLVGGFLEEHQIDLGADSTVLQRVRDASERAKIALSEVSPARIDEPYICSGRGRALHLQRSLTRESFEDLVIGLCERCIRLGHEMLEDASIDVEELHEVLFVGGQTRMPGIRQMVGESFGIDGSDVDDPDEAVALGAAILGASLVDRSSSIRMTDVTPHNLGFRVHGGDFDVILQRNATLPATACRVISTAHDDQTSIRFEVFQGQSRRAEEQERLGEYVLSDLRCARRGKVEIELTFEVSVDGIVSVHAKDGETGQPKSMTVSGTAGLTEHEVQQMTEDARRYAINTGKPGTLQHEAYFALAMVRAIRNLPPEVADFMRVSEFGRAEIQRIESLIESAERAVERGDGEELGRLNRPLESALRMHRNVRPPPPLARATSVPRPTPSSRMSGGASVSPPAPSNDDEV